MSGRNGLGRATLLLWLCAGAACGRTAGSAPAFDAPASDGGLATVTADAASVSTDVPNPPRNVQASTDIEAHVRVSFEPPRGLAPTSYRILRDGRAIATLPADETSFDDAGAGPPTLGAPRELRASQGTSAEGVELSWLAPDDSGSAGSEHAYRVVALRGAVPSAPSEEALGHRAAAHVIEYEFSRDGERTWIGTGSDEVRYIDRGAPPAELAPGVAHAKAFLVPRGAIRLQVTDTRVERAEVIYRVRARSLTASGGSSPPAVGHRSTATDPSFQWQRSTGADDAEFVDLVGVTGPSWVDASLPPATRRSYRALVSLGDGQELPTQAVSVRSEAAALDASAEGGGSACAVTVEGSLQCWGGERAVILTDLGDEPYARVSKSSSRVCALLRDGPMRCWGDRSYGATPAGPTAVLYDELAIDSIHYCGVRRGDKSLECVGTFGSDGGAVQPPAGAFASIRSKSSYACGLRTDGALQCFGREGTRGPKAPTGDRFVAVALGSGIPCAVRDDGKLLCWQTTDGDPVTPKGAETLDFVDIADGLALTRDGRVFKYRHDLRDELRQLEGADYRDLVTRCAITDDGRLDCLDQTVIAPLPPEVLADGLLPDREGVNVVDTDGVLHLLPLSAARVIPDAERPSRVKALAVAGYTYACAILLDDSVECWGQLVAAQTPTLPDGRYAEIAISETHVCGIDIEGHLSCAGPGDGDVPVPTQPTTERYRELAAGTRHFCAFDETGEVQCFGAGTAVAVPERVNSVRSFAVGARHNCALREDDQLVCWGDNASGQAPPGPRYAGEITALSAGAAHTCGLRRDGRVMCWGSNSAGQAPVGLSLGRYREIRASERATCGLRDDRKVVCWGAGFAGQDGLPLVTP